MEAKVDIRKLQLLNDRITQCLEAVNQVRLSVHGAAPGPIGITPQLSHSPFVPYGTPQAGAWGGAQLGMQAPFIGQPQLTPYGVYGQPFGGGVSHSDPVEQRFIEARASDPARLAQTFPFAFTAQVPGYGLGYLGHSVHPTQPMMPPMQPIY